MAYTDIDKPTDYFETTTYAGGTTSITSLDFSPDWVWAKKRTGAENHGIFDSVRGATKTINSNTTSAETTRGGSLTSFDSNGWSMGGADGIISASGNDYVAWAWRGSDSSAVSNTDGSITSTVSANTTSGFSIVTYSGNSTAGSTFGHGLGVKPSMIITKARTRASMWNVYHKGLTNYTKGIYLNATDAEFDGGAFADGEPNANTFTLSNGTHVNGSGETYVAYCFAEKQGYSKFGSYTGNGSTDGTFVYTGFKPAFVIIKKTDGADNWTINDNKRVGYNVDNNELFANLSNAEDTNDVLDLLSNGFKLRHTAGRHNTSGGTYIYMCFAESPFVTSSGIPTCAR
jgi:hypothetical protein